MAWTYSGDPADGGVDEIRFLIGDVDEDRQLLTDEGIAYVIARLEPVYGSPLMAAAACAEAIAGKFAREVSVSADGVSVAVDSLQQKYNELAASLRDQYKNEMGTAPIASGTLLDDAPDFSIKPLMFGIGFMDNYRAGSQDYGNYDPSSLALELEGWS